MIQYQVSFGDAIKRAFSNYCCFTGRASRSEYWWFFLFCFIVGSILNALNFPYLMKGEYSVYTGISYLWSLAIFLPSMGLLFRRLHDTGRSGWNWCWAFLPVIGAIILLVYVCQDSQMTENRYGSVPNVIEK